MSHVVAFSEIVYPEASIHDGTLAEALDKIGLELKVGQTHFNWFGSWVKDYNKEDAAYKQGVSPEKYGQCEHAIRGKGAAPDAYEIGLVKNPKGAGYIPVLDFFGSGNRLRQLVGDQGQHLGTAYNEVAFRAQAKAEHYQAVEKTILPNGKIKLVATKYGV